MTELGWVAQELLDARRPKAERKMSGKFTMKLRPLSEAERAEVVRHLGESRALMTSQLERMDMAFFRASAEDVQISNPLTVTVEKIIAAISSGVVVVEFSSLGRRARYGVSAILYSSYQRAQGSWHSPLDTPSWVGVLGELAQQWDSFADVHGSPGERARMRTEPERV